MDSKMNKAAHQETANVSRTDPIFNYSQNNFPDFSKKLVCITYPGKVKNTDKMFDTLGGIQTIEQVVAHPRRNMELRFRPEDSFCKPCISERSTKPNILLKIKVRKAKNVSGSKDSEINSKTEIISYEVVGLTAVAFSFNKLCDFQYLPLSSKSNIETSESTLEYIHDKILPNDLPDLQWFENVNTQSLTIFYPPASFSKSDVTASNLYFNRSTFYEGKFRAHYADRFRNQEIQRKVAQSKQDSTKLRNVLLCRIDDELPSEPNKIILNNFQSRVSVINGLNDSLIKMKKFFADRPIASKICLHYHIQLSNEHYKIVLPCVAYYFLNGPWRMMWIRYGYDPRKEGNSRMYQSLDFRIRSVVGLKRYINAKRSFPRKMESLLSTSYRNTESQPSTSAQSLLQVINEASVYNPQLEKHTITEDSFMLRPGLIPSCRQLMYQYCDVQLPDIQAMLSRLPSILPGTPCDPKNGWLPPGFNDQCREIVTKYIDAEINRAMESERTSAAASSAADMDEDGKGDVGEKEGILHEILSNDSSSSEDLSDDDDRGNDVGVDEDLLDEIDKLIDVKECN